MQLKASSFDFIIEKTTTYAIDLMDRYPEGQIHSIYAKTINILFGNGMLALQIDGSQLSPLSLITDQSPASLSSLPLQVHDRVRWIPQRSILQISSSEGSETVGWVCPNPYRSLLLTPESSIYNNCILKSQIREILSIQRNEFFQLIFPDPDHVSTLSLTGQLLQPRIQSICREYLEELLQNHIPQAAASLASMIGIGIGLTPSGDDFLCGVLAGLRLGGLHDHPFTLALKDAILHNLHRTNPISAAFLKCAVQDQFAEMLHLLTVEPTRQELMEHVLAIGHSSGADTLCGVLFSESAAKHLKQ